MKKKIHLLISENYVTNSIFKKAVEKICNDLDFDYMLTLSNKFSDDPRYDMGEIIECRSDSSINSDLIIANLFDVKWHIPMDQITSYLKLHIPLILVLNKGLTLDEKIINKSFAIIYGLNLEDAMVQLREEVTIWKNVVYTLK